MSRKNESMSENHDVVNILNVADAIENRWKGYNSRDIELAKPLPDWREIVGDIEKLVSLARKVPWIADHEFSEGISTGYANREDEEEEEIWRGEEREKRK